MSNGHKIGIWKDGYGHVVINYEDVIFGEDKKITIFKDGTAAKHEHVYIQEGEYMEILYEVDLAQALFDLVEHIERSVE